MGRAKDEFIRLQETPIMEACAECQGTGTVDVEVARPQSFSRDIGELDIEEETKCRRGKDITLNSGP